MKNNITKRTIAIIATFSFITGAILSGGVVAYSANASAVKIVISNILSKGKIELKQDGEEVVIDSNDIKNNSEAINDHADKIDSLTTEIDTTNEELENINELISEALPNNLQFVLKEDGSIEGYKVGGADTVIPFSSDRDFELIIQLHVKMTCNSWEYSFAPNITIKRINGVFSVSDIPQGQHSSWNAITNNATFYTYIYKPTIVSFRWL